MLSDMVSDKIVQVTDAAKAIRCLRVIEWHCFNHNVVDARGDAL